MAWSLEIHHIDVEQGDSTLIVARETAPIAGAVPIVRSALIDGGRLRKAPDVHNEITNRAGLTQVDVMAATHYDADHYCGLRGLLNLNTTVYDNVNIFDQGEPGSWTGKRNSDRSFQIVNRDNDYLRYLNAIKKRGARHRPTETVISDATGRIPTGWHAPGWLVGQEILWYNYPGGKPAGAPTMICIAANQQILQNAGGTVYLPSGTGVDPKNEKSLAFLITLNQFKYYVGGDIESTQEDGTAGSNNGIMHYLNSANNNGGRILAMKTSHHGSDRSTSANFVNRLRPSAAFISCGFNNSFIHPRPVVLGNLQAHGNLQHYYLTEDRAQAEFDTRVGAAGPPPVPPNINAAYSNKAVVAGAWGLPDDSSPNQQEGYVQLTVTHTQSMNPVYGALPAGQSRFTVTCFTADIAANGPLNTDHT